MVNPVVFKFGLRAQYDALQTKDPNALYFLTDSHELYKGADAIATNSGLYSDIKTVENSDIEVINNYYTNNSKVPFIGDVFIVRTHIVDEDYAQSVYMYDGQKWESISSTVMIEGDNKSIEVDEHNVIALKDYGKRFYKFIEETGSKEDGTFVASHYELVEVDENNPWIAGLEPRVVLEGSEYVIGWYQPNLVTAEGVKEQVIAVQGTVTEVQKTVNDVQEDVTDLTEILKGADGQGGLVGDVADITETLYGAGEDATGLVDDVANIAQDLANNYYTKTDIETNYYTKTDIDGKVSGVFHFKDTADSKEALPTTGNTAGDVYQVGDREYAWNGTEWVELGFVVDLSSHATKAELKQVADDLDLAEKEIDNHADRIGDVEAALNTETTGLIAVAGDLSSRMNAVESTLNTETTGLVAVASDLQTRVGKLEAVGAEKNVLVGVSLNGTALEPNEGRIVNIVIPDFNGTVAGLVPVADTLNNTYYLNATGEWSIPMDSRIGNLGDSATVVDYVDNAINVAFTWSEIGQ